MISTDEEVAEQIPSLNIHKSFNRELIYFFVEIAFILTTLIILSVAVSNLLDDSHWIKEAFTK